MREIHGRRPLFVFRGEQRSRRIRVAPEERAHGVGLLRNRLDLVIEGAAAPFPEVIILDEPTVGLDPQQIIDIRALIRRLGETKTVILSSHILAEIREVCDHIIIISRGKIVADSPLEELESRVGDSTTLRMSIKGGKDTILDVINTYPSVRACRVLADKGGIVELELELPRGLDIRDELFFAMAAKRCAVINIEQQSANLEEVFLALTDKTHGTPDKRALRDKKRREKMLGNITDAAGTQDGGDAQ